MKSQRLRFFFQQGIWLDFFSPNVWGRKMKGCHRRISSLMFCTSRHFWPSLWHRGRAHASKSRSRGFQSCVVLCVLLVILLFFPVSFLLKKLTLFRVEWKLFILWRTRTWKLESSFVQNLALWCFPLYGMARVFSIYCGHTRASFQQVRAKSKSHHLLPKERKKAFGDSWNQTQVLMVWEWLL